MNENQEQCNQVESEATGPVFHLQKEIYGMQIQTWQKKSENMFTFS